MALTQTEVDYCAADAQTTAAIRGAQRIACDRAGIGEALDRVVMPWTVTAAEIEWVGVWFDRAQCQAFLDASTRARGGSAWSCGLTASPTRTALSNWANS